MLSTVNLTMRFGPKPLFENISVKFGDANRYGLIGANGCGKSTFMKILGGDLEPSFGNVILDSGIRLGKLKQDQFSYESIRVLDVVLMGHIEMWKVKKERDAIYASTESTDEDYMRAADLEAKFAEYGGYTSESRASELLLGLGIPIEYHENCMNRIPPGRKLRVLLAQALFSNPDVLLLDEPTNNLDINTIRWLENILNQRNSTMIIVSHDRHFLNQVCTHIVDMDYGTVKIYPGNYDEYMEASSIARQRLLSANAKAKERIADLQEFIRRFSANKSKSNQATSRRKQIEKIKIEDIKPSSRQHPFIRFQLEKKLHNFAIIGENLSKIYDRKIFECLNLTVQSGEKIAIVGENGVGKTTLLRTLLGELQVDSGSIKWAENANIGYIPQDVNEVFSKNMTLIEWIGQFAKEGDSDQILRSTLGRLLFGNADLKKSVHVLSGGEKRRMVWGKLILGKHNILLMDEPTNHMDMESIESLQVALELFEGTVIFVSHDREFVNAIAHRVLEIHSNGIITDHHGTYEEYLRSQGIN